MSFHGDAPCRLSLRSRLGVAVAACAAAPLLSLLVAIAAGLPLATAAWLAVAGALAVGGAVSWLLDRAVVRPLQAFNRRLAVDAVNADSPGAVAAGAGDGIAEATSRYAALIEHAAAREKALLSRLDAAHEAAAYNQLLQETGIEIGGELAAFSLPQLSQLAVDRVREGLKADAAILCLHDEVSGRRVSATSGDVVAGITEEPVRAACGHGRCDSAACPAIDGGLPVRIAVPVAWGDTDLGQLCVGYRSPRVLSQLEENFLRDFCHMLAIGLSNARLHWNLEALATLEERERIAGDLHDGIIQSLYGTGLGLIDCIRLVEDAPAQARERLEKTIEDLNAVIRDVRNYIVGLESDVLQRTRLSEAIGDFVLRMSLNGALEVRLELDPACDEQLTREQSGHLFQVCREAFLNIVKHAQAKIVIVRLTRRGDVVRVEVEDDGRGVDLHARGRGGRGLKNIDMRARRMGGRSSIEALPAGGTRVVVEVPLEQGA